MAKPKIFTKKYAYKLKSNQLMIFLKISFIFREGKGERKRGRETSMCGCLSHAPYWGPSLQPRHVP